MCSICGQPDFIRCNCQSAQPFCDQCAEDVTCVDKLDSACVFYHLILPNEPPPPPSRLINLGLPNNTSAQTIFETIDQFLGIAGAGPITVTNTNAIQIAQDGPGGRHLTPSLILSQASGNTAIIEPDGLYVPPQIYKVKVDNFHIPYFLADALIGGTDGIVSLSFEPVDGILFGLPTINMFAAIEAIINNSTLITLLTTSIVNTIINDPTILKTLMTAVENYILNDSTFITDLTQTIVNNPASQQLLCQQIEACQSGMTGCVAPTVTDATIDINPGGATESLTVTFTPASPPPVDGYILFYRLVGGSTYATQTATTSPITIPNLPAGDYEGYLVSDCGGSSFSSGSTFTTSGDYFNVNTTNTLTGMTIQSVTGIPGYTLHGPVPVSGSDTGLHSGFTGAISMTVSGTAGINGNAGLIVNGHVIGGGCFNINAGSSPTVFNFPSHTYAPGDQIQVTLNTGFC